MGKIRSISLQALFRDVELAETLGFNGTVLYGLLVDITEYPGCFELNPKQIHIDFGAHHKSITTNKIGMCLDILVRQKKIIPYQVNGKWYGWLKNFKKYYPDLSFLPNPTIPLPDFIKWQPKTKEQKQDYIINYTELIGDTLVKTYVGTSVITGVGTNKLSYVRLKKEVNTNTPPITPPCELTEKQLKKIILEENKEKIAEWFNRFWDSYPKKKAKKKAWRAWQKLKFAQIRPYEIIEAVELAKQTPEWKKDKGQFVPHPATFLNGERWEDEDLQERES